MTGAEEASFEDSTGVVPQEARSPAAIMIVSNCFFILDFLQWQLYAPTCMINVIYATVEYDF